jgi:hypothetical protein
MWTPEQTQEYNRRMDASHKAAKKLGVRLAKLFRRKVKKASRESNWQEPGIDSIYIPLFLTPAIEALDDAYDTLGGVNFEWVINLYVGRKVNRIVPLLVAIAEKLKAGGHDAGNKADGGGADGRVWCDLNTPKDIALRIDTQSRSYYVNLWDQYGSGSWRLEVIERKRDQPRKKPKESWRRERGLVLKYQCPIPGVSEQPKECEHAWLNLARVARFLNLINPTCTALGINLYKPPFDTAQPAADDDE